MMIALSLMVLVKMIFSNFIKENINSQQKMIIMELSVENIEGYSSCVFIFKSLKWFLSF